jgi:hypothetical protein
MAMAINIDGTDILLVGGRKLCGEQTGMMARQNVKKVMGFFS